MPNPAGYLIWSGEHRLWWRRDDMGRGSGYCKTIGAAGRWTLEDCERVSGHCGPEKQIEIVPDPFGPFAEEPPDLAVQHKFESREDFLERLVRALCDDLWIEGLQVPASFWVVAKAMGWKG